MTDSRTGGAAGTILFVVPSLHGGGAEFVARTWMAWLVSRGYTVSVVTTSMKATGEYLPQGVTSYSVGRAKGQTAKARAVKDLFDVTGAEVAVGLQSYANLVLLTAQVMAGAKSPKVIVSERNLVSLGLRGADLAHRSKSWMARRLYRRADHVIAISHPVAGELVASYGIRGDRMTVVPNPATAKVAGRERIRREPSETSIQIALPCRLVTQKRPMLAIDTAAELNRRGITAEVVSFGGGPLRDELVAAAATANVTFIEHNWVEDWFTHLSEKAVVLLPSSREGFGNVLIEAAAMGVPSVAVSGALGVADAVAPGISGELALTERASDLADAVIRANGLSLDGIENWLARFSVESSGRDLERVLRLVLEKSS